MYGCVCGGRLSPAPRFRSGNYTQLLERKPTSQGSQRTPRCVVSGGNGFAASRDRFTYGKAQRQWPRSNFVLGADSHRARTSHGLRPFGQAALRRCRGSDGVGLWRSGRRGSFESLRALRLCPPALPRGLAESEGGQLAVVFSIFSLWGPCMRSVRARRLRRLTRTRNLRIGHSEAI